jgi:peroxiredoxin
MRYQAIAATILSCAALATVGCPPPGSVGSDSSLLEPGEVAPLLTGEGWLNGTVDTADLKGKVVVVDAFAFWCQPCADAAVELVEIHNRHRDNPELQFVGITGEGSDSQAETQAFVDRLNIDWPVLYGANDSMTALGVEYLPSVVVIGRDGRITWHNYLPGDLEAEIAEALAAEG